VTLGIVLRLWLLPQKQATPHCFPTVCLKQRRHTLPGLRKLAALPERAFLARMQLPVGPELPRLLVHHFRGPPPKQIAPREQAAMLG